jgi:hypothetical protein
MTRRDLLRMILPGLTLAFGGCADEKPKGHVRRIAVRKPTVDLERQHMVAKIRKGYEAAKVKEKVKEEYGSTLRSASKRVRRVRVKTGTP